MAKREEEHLSMNISSQKAQSLEKQLVGSEQIGSLLTGNMMNMFIVGNARIGLKILLESTWL